MTETPTGWCDNRETAPGPNGGLVWGSLAEFQADSIGFLSDSVRKYGDIVRFRFGPVIAYLVNRPEYVQHVLSRGARHYDKQTRSVSKLRATCGDSLLSCDGEQWLRHRRLIQPVFQPQRVQTFLPTVVSSTEEMLETWQGKARRGEELDIVSEMMSLTMSIAARVLFESDIRDRTKVIEQSLAVILQDTWRRLESLVDMSMISPLFRRPGFRRALAEIDRVVYRIIEQRRQSTDAPDDLLSRLLRAHETSEGTRLSDKELRDAVVTLLLAGHETTANALASSFYLISQSPHCEDRLEDEARQNLSGNSSSDLPQAHMAFSEVIRIYPSIWIIERRVVADDQMGAFKIPKGSTVILSPYLLHRHPEFWPEPQAFEPDRFAPDRSAGRPRYAYIPFGLGAHRCIGEHMATLVATQVLSRVYRDYRLRLVAGQKLRLEPGITLRHSGELRMKLHHVGQLSKTE